MSLLPSVCRFGHSFVIGACFPPRMGGSTVVARELLARFNPSSYTIVTLKPPHGKRLHSTSDSEIRVISSGYLPTRLQGLWRFLQIPWASRFVLREVRRRQVKVIISVYPTLECLRIAQWVSKRAHIPLVVYLHDTIAEGLSHTVWRHVVASLQRDVFKSASALLVMSDGMVDLYRKKYGVKTLALPHIYPEEVPEHIGEEPVLQQGFWSGAIYGINDASVRRVFEALRECQLSFFLTTRATIRELTDVWGLRGDGVQIGYFDTRGHYLQALRRQGILVLALNWPDETAIHVDEVSTIFPTKTPEYLASGRPILVHCPKEYYLARFFAEHKCGLVVSDRSPAALAEACRLLLKDDEMTRGLRQCALVAAKRFAPDRIAACFCDTVDRAASSPWGEKVL